MKMELIEKYEAKKQKAEQDIIAKKQTVDNLKAQLAALDNDIITAIDADSLDEVEQLTRSKHDLEVRIDAAESIIKRKQESGGVTLEEAISAWEEDRKQREKTIKAKTDRANKLLQDAINGAADLAREIATGNLVRARYARLIGAELNSGDGYKFVPLHSPLKLMSFFKTVCSDFVTDISPEDKENITKTANPYYYNPM